MLLLCTSTLLTTCTIQTLHEALPSNNIWSTFHNLSAGTVTRDMHFVTRGMRFSKRHAFYTPPPFSPVSFSGNLAGAKVGSNWQPHCFWDSNGKAEARKGASRCNRYKSWRGPQEERQTFSNKDKGEVGAGGTAAAGSGSYEQCCSQGGQRGKAGTRAGQAGCPPPLAPSQRLHHPSGNNRNYLVSSSPHFFSFSSRSAHARPPQHSCSFSSVSFLPASVCLSCACVYGKRHQFVCVGAVVLG